MVGNNNVSIMGGKASRQIENPFLARTAHGINSCFLKEHEPPSTKLSSRQHRCDMAHPTSTWLMTSYSDENVVKEIKSV